MSVPAQGNQYFTSVQNTIVQDSVNQVTYNNDSVETINVGNGELVINPNIPNTYIINNTNGDEVTLTMGNPTFPGQWKYITVTQNTQSSNLIINFTDNYGNINATTSTFGTAGDIVQFISSVKGWGIPWFDIK